MRLTMKGKRKAETSKWLMKGQFEKGGEANTAETIRDASNHFLDAAAIFGVEHEPVGLLTGKLLWVIIFSKLAS